MPYVKPLPPKVTQFKTIAQRLMTTSLSGTSEIATGIDEKLQELVNEEGWQVLHMWRVNHLNVVWRVITLRRVVPQDLPPDHPLRKEWYANGQS